MSIAFRGVAHTYNSGTPFSYAALKNVDLTLEEGKITAIIGETGSGKSTLVQHLNALLLPTQGELEVCGKRISAKEKPKNLKELRKNVGLVFQFPEYQLFEESVEKDIAFGPKNFGASSEEASAIAKRILPYVGLGEEYLQRSPFELSGGQKRRVAIAGILAMDPNVLVLDEPTAGLDPAGRDQILNLLKKLHQKKGMAILLVSHSMEDVADCADRVIVMNHGEVMYDGDKREVFSHKKELEAIGLSVPFYRSLAEELRERGFMIKEDVLTLEETKEAIMDVIRKKRDNA